MTEQEAISQIVKDDHYVLNQAGDRAEESGFTFEVVEREEGSPQRWHFTVSIVVKSNAGNWWAWSYDAPNTEYQDPSEPSEPYRVQPVTRTVEVTSFERIQQEETTDL